LPISRAVAKVTHSLKWGLASLACQPPISLLSPLVNRSPQEICRVQDLPLVLIERAGIGLSSLRLYSASTLGPPKRPAFASNDQRHPFSWASSLRLSFACFAPFIFGALIFVQPACRNKDKWPLALTGSGLDVTNFLFPPASQHPDCFRDNQSDFISIPDELDPILPTGFWRVPNSCVYSSLLFSLPVFPPAGSREHHFNVNDVF